MTDSGDVSPSAPFVGALNSWEPSERLRCAREFKPAANDRFWRRAAFRTIRGSFEFVGAL
jgi:hypothetical protein